MTTIRRVHYTYGEYLALEEASPTRHEYLDGEIYAMAGGTPDHAALAAAIIAILSSAPPGCRAFTADLRARVQSTGLTTYPDAAIVCGKSERAAEDPLAVTNPVVLVEVTSPSTEDYDRGEKLRQYQSIPSVKEVIFVSHASPELTLHARTAEGWTVKRAVAGGAIELDSIGIQLVVDQVYKGGLEDAPS